MNKTDEKNSNLKKLNDNEIGEVAGGKTNLIIDTIDERPGSGGNMSGDVFWKCPNCGCIASKRLGWEDRYKLHQEDWTCKKCGHLCKISYTCGKYGTFNGTITS